MNTQASALNESSLPSAAETASTSISELQRLLWSVRREFWENRALYIAPIAGGAVMIFGFLLGALGLTRHTHALQTMDSTQLLRAMAIPFNIAGGLSMGLGMIVAVFYCLDALYGERRDRTILFWKSLPVSDLTAVLAKASIPLLLLPLILFVVTLITQWCMLLIATTLLLVNGHSAAILWTGLSLSQRWLLLFWHFYAVHAFWYAPFFGWFLFVSAWARRTPLLWAFLPPLALAIFEKLVFNTAHFATLITNRLQGAGSNTTNSLPGTMPLDPGTQITLGHFLASPGLWIGFAITALFLAAAIQLRRYRSTL